MDDHLDPAVGGDAEGVPALEELDEHAGDRGDGLPGGLRHDGAALAGHPFSKDLVRDLGERHGAARNGGEDAHQPPPFRSRFMRSAIRSLWVPMTT